MERFDQRNGVKSPWKSTMWREVPVPSSLRKGGFVVAQGLRTPPVDGGKGGTRGHRNVRRLVTLHLLSEQRGVTAGALRGFLLLIQGPNPWDATTILSHGLGSWLHWWNVCCVSRKSEFRFPASRKSGMPLHICNPALRRWRQEAAWSLLASQPSWIDKTTIQWETLSQEETGRVLEKDNSCCPWSSCT